MSWDKYSGFFEKLNQEERNVLIKCLKTARSQLTLEEDRIALHLLHYLGWKGTQPTQKKPLFQTVLNYVQQWIKPDKWDTMKP